MGSKILVAYFSASGETARLAKTLAGAMNADLYEIKPAVSYTAADLNWNNKQSRSTREMDNAAARPKIEGSVADMDRYTAVFVGFPIWWYEAPRIIQTFLEAYDFSGKTVIPFATSGGSGLGDTDKILHKSCSAATRWQTGKRLSSSANEAAIKSWLESLGL